MDKDKALNFNERRDEKTHEREGKILGGKFSGIKSQRTARKLERERILSDPKLIAQKLAEIKVSSRPSYIPQWLKNSVNEDHAMDKPKPLEEVSDGDLSEIKKDPIWKTWLNKQDEDDIHDEEDEDELDEEDEATEAERKVQQVVGGGAIQEGLHLLGLSWKSWLKEKGVKGGQYTGPSHRDTPSGLATSPKNQPRTDKHGKVTDANIKGEGTGYTALMHPKDILARMANANYKRDRVGNTGTGKQFENFPSSRTERDSRQSDIRNRDTSVPRPSLWVDSETGQVRAHESRHQTRAMLDEGVTSTPVDIIPNASGTNVKHIKPEDIKGEKMSEHWYKNTEEGNKEGNEQFKKRKQGKKRRRNEQRENIKRKKVLSGIVALKNYLDDERRENQRKREQKRNENIHSDFTGDPDRMTPTPEQIERKRIRNEKEAQEAIDSKARHTHRRKKKSWEALLENITKPIPDSKGGKGSFRHCINANQDKHNPGGWCKQIERKVEGKKKGRDEGEKEEVKISTYTKLRRIKDRLQAHKKKAKKVPTKEVKLPQTKIDEPKHWWDHSKVGTQGDIDQKTGRPWWEVMTEERERRKKEKEKKKADKIEEPESDYYMDAGGNPQRKEKKYTPKHPMTRVHNRESELRQEQRKTKPYKFCPTCGDKMPIETRRRVEEKEKAKKIGSWEQNLGTDAELAARKKRVKELKDNDAEIIETSTSDANKTDYFVEEIRSNIIYHNKIFPLVGMIAGQVARGLGGAAKKIGPKLLEDVGEVSQGMMEEDEEQ
jgi:hypothetical protein